MTGDDILFGEGQNDDIIGGRGNDRISAGTGHDGVLGDDGRISTSRNGVVAIPANQLNLTVSTTSRQNEALINVAGALKKTADLEPFEYGGNDIIYGGLGGDAISGAEALSTFFVTAINPGNILRFVVVRAGEFAAYNYLSPRVMIQYFPLNFESSVAGAKVHDGNDVLFGDHGNDWLVGGTNIDHLHGGIGSDLLNADDSLETNGGFNDGNELGTYGDADLAYGGGKDVLIANTTQDRLIDCCLTANTFFVPFNNVTAPTVTSTQETSLNNFLVSVSRSDGADPTRVGPGSARLRATANRSASSASSPRPTSATRARPRYRAPARTPSTTRSSAPASTASLPPASRCRGTSPSVSASRPAWSRDSRSMAISTWAASIRPARATPPTSSATPAPGSCSPARRSAPAPARCASRSSVPTGED